MAKTPVCSTRLLVPGRGADYHIMVRAFNSTDEMHKFLNKQDHNRWLIMSKPYPSGHYFEQGVGGYLIPTHRIAR